MNKWLAAFIVCAAALTSRGATYKAASVDRDDVLAALALCSSNDTLQIPAGTAVWTNYVQIDLPLIVAGAGTNATVVYSATLGDDANSPDNYLFYVTHDEGFVNLSDMTLVGNATNVGTRYRSGIHVSNGSGGLTNNITRIYRVDFERTQTGIWERSDGTGLIGKVRFVDVDRPFYALANNASTTNTFADLLTSAVTNSFGTTNAWYMEDWHAEVTTNWFNYATEESWIVASGHGARWVVRHGTYESADPAYFRAGQVDQHGNQASGVQTVLFSEFYGNRIRTEGAYRLFNHRGGAALIYDNVTWSAADDVISVGYEFQEEGVDACHNPDPGYDGQEVHSTWVWDNIVTNGVTTVAQLVVDSQWLRIHPDCCTNVLSFGSSVVTTEPGWYTPLEYPHPLASVAPFEPSTSPLGWSPSHGPNYTNFWMGVLSP